MNSYTMSIFRWTTSSYEHLKVIYEFSNDLATTINIGYTQDKKTIPAIQLTILCNLYNENHIRL